jgi:hypothetical protein
LAGTAYFSNNTTSKGYKKNILTLWALLSYYTISFSTSALIGEIGMRTIDHSIELTELISPKTENTKEKLLEFKEDKYAYLSEEQRKILDGRINQIVEAEKVAEAKKANEEKIKKEREKIEAAKKEKQAKIVLEKEKAEKIKRQKQEALKEEQLVKERQEEIRECRRAYNALDSVVSKMQDDFDDVNDLKDFDLSECDTYIYLYEKLEENRGSTEYYP